MTVASITLTLFLPCIAQFLIMKKERGWPMALLTSAIALATAFAAGFVVNGVLDMSGARL